MEALAREIPSSRNSIASNLVKATELGFLFLINYTCDSSHMKFSSLNFTKIAPNVFQAAKKRNYQKGRIHISDITMKQFYNVLFAKPKFWNSQQVFLHFYFKKQLENHKFPK